MVGSLGDIVMGAGMKAMPIKQRVELIEYIMDKSLKIVNEKINVGLIKKELAFGEERTVCIRVPGLIDDGIEFKLTDTAVIRIPNTHKPTVTLEMSDDTFIQIARGKLSFNDAFWYSDARAYGDNWLRDYEVMKTLFESFSHLSNELGINV